MVITKVRQIQTAFDYDPNKSIMFLARNMGMPEFLIRQIH